jgi:hypothetical protein
MTTVSYRVGTFVLNYLSIFKGNICMYQQPRAVLHIYSQYQYPFNDKRLKLHVHFSARNISYLVIFFPKIHMYIKTSRCLAFVYFRKFVYTRVSLILLLTFDFKFGVFLGIRYFSTLTSWLFKLLITNNPNFLWRKVFI